MTQHTDIQRSAPQGSAAADERTFSHIGADYRVTASDDDPGALRVERLGPASAWTRTVEYSGLGDDIRVGTREYRRKGGALRRVHRGSHGADTYTWPMEGADEVEALAEMADLDAIAAAECYRNTLRSEAASRAELRRLRQCPPPVSYRDSAGRLRGWQR